MCGVWFLLRIAWFSGSQKPRTKRSTCKTSRHVVMPKYLPLHLHELHHVSVESSRVACLRSCPILHLGQSAAGCRRGGRLCHQARPRWSRADASALDLAVVDHCQQWWSHPQLVRYRVWSMLLLSGQAHPGHSSPSQERLWVRCLTLERHCAWTDCEGAPGRLPAQCLRQDPRDRPSKCLECHPGRCGRRYDSRCLCGYHLCSLSGRGLGLCLTPEKLDFQSHNCCCHSKISCPPGSRHHRLCSPACLSSRACFQLCLPRARRCRGVASLELLPNRHHHLHLRRHRRRPHTSP